MSADALALLMEHNWPGNVRELKNSIERLVIMIPSEQITADDIPPFMKTSPKSDTDAGSFSAAADSFRAAKMEWEKNYILRKLQENDGNISRTADSIGLERSNLHRKIKSYGLDGKKE
jgi:two-component system nitrogen regulation response regulator NtrX